MKLKLVCPAPSEALLVLWPQDFLFFSLSATFYLFYLCFNIFFALGFELQFFSNFFVLFFNSSLSGCIILFRMLFLRGYWHGLFTKNILFIFGWVLLLFGCFFSAIFFLLYNFSFNLNICWYHFLCGHHLYMYFFLISVQFSSVQGNN